MIIVTTVGMTERVSIAIYAYLDEDISPWYDRDVGMRGGMKVRPCEDSSVSLLR